MTEYLLDRYPDGSYETFEYDDDTGNITVRRWADVQPAIDTNKQAHLDGDGKPARHGWPPASPIASPLLWKQNSMASMLTGPSTGRRLESF